MLLPWWQDGEPLGWIYFNLSSGMLIRTSFPYVRQMVLAYVSIEGWIVHPDDIIASLMALMRFWSSLPTILKVSMVVS